MITSNMISARSNKPVPNQFIIFDDTTNTTYFQSYKTIIAKKVGGQIYLDTNSWDYSMTTGKYRNQFLQETKKETEEKIKNGTYILTNLNSKNQIKGRSL